MACRRKRKMGKRWIIQNLFAIMFAENRERIFKMEWRYYAECNGTANPNTDL